MSERFKVGVSAGLVAVFGLATLLGASKPPAHDCMKAITEELAEYDAGLKDRLDVISDGITQLLVDQHRRSHPFEQHINVETNAMLATYLAEARNRRLKHDEAKKEKERTFGQNGRDAGSRTPEDAGARE